MTKILIESNPYEQNINYSRFDETSGEYLPITQEESASSGLLSDNFKKCFFPFKAKEILDVIVDDYGNNIEIFFDGSSDEYKELLDVKQTSDKFCNVIISKGDKYLEDGRDVINQINEVFKLIEPIVKDSVGSNDENINKNLKKYSDASNDVIPICVIGNTNMGKSTFINALLGAEYLPQDKNRCTAKIYKITQSNQIDRANISFDFNEKPVIISFKGDLKIEGELSLVFKEELSKILEADTNVSLSHKINKLLRFLNLYDEKHQVQAISDMIKLEVPFNSDVFQKSHNPFVIFDTPGSNYAGNTKDSELLKQQMKDLTNGLPIFVTDYNGLPTKDNDELIKELQSFDELDQRFTILIVNKADTAKLDSDSWSEEEEKRIIEENVPNKLAERGLQGVYFVSSIMGLGYKNNGDYLEKQDKKLFSKNKDDYNGTDEDFLFYKFNILPEQLKTKFVNDILTKNVDPIYLNSGLYSIEKEIETYANTYSAYNKCQQSRVFLEKVYNDTNIIIEKKNKEIEIQKKALLSNFEKEKKELIEKLQKEVDGKKKDCYTFRDVKIKEELGKKVIYFQKDDFQIIENKIFENKRDDFSVDSSEEESKNANQKKWLELRYGMSETGKKIISIFTKKSSLSDIRKKFSETLKKAKVNFQDASSKNKILKEKNTIAEQESYKESLEVFLSEFDEKLSVEQDSIYKESKDYWEANSDELRRMLTSIVTMSNALADDQKESVIDIIANYSKIDFEKRLITDSQQEDFKSWRSERIDISKVESHFNKLMKKIVEQLYKETHKSHKDVFEQWVNTLFCKICSEIGDMNPTLKLYQDTIDRLTKRKQELEQNSMTLEDYFQDISEMISWKE